ncbi:hypothetical protein OYC64_005278 [Pagothenia borchgrevinki]|uniref:Chromogranin-A n=1 Tax=Pagothenia borchgrevinki TaxID=8213 RepID=A0ABD2GG77_PAGBO
MIGRGLFVLTLLSSCVLSLPVTPSQLENEDVKVMKCIVEALADVLSRPRPKPVSQECLTMLKTDDRLVSILRHHNFLKELQEIAVRGGQERALLQRDATAEPTTQSPQTADDFADRSMLEALGGPGERSILSQKKRDGNGDREEDKEDSRGNGESQEDNHVAGEVKEKRGKNESPGSHASESEDESTEGKAEKREKEEEEEKRANSEEEHVIKQKKGAGSGEKGDAPSFKSKENTFVEEEWDDVKRFAPEKKQEEDERETKMEGSLKRWAKRGKALALRKKAVGKELNTEQEVPHHSQELTEEEEEKKRNTHETPEEKELQMIARRTPEERRGLEDEGGSGSRKTEQEPEIESLAAIESELENVAQKLHEMRRG